MSSNVNFTAAIDKDLLKRAKIMAAQNDTSINALLNTQLRYLVETYESSAALRNDNYATLLAFSLGRLSDQEAMAKLNIDSEEDLFLLMAQAHLPLPRLPDTQTDAMVKALHGLAGQ